MARVLVVEPYPEIRQLLQHIVAGLGFEPVLPDHAAPETLEAIDVLLLEPGLPGGVELATRLREANLGLPILVVSIYPPTPEVTALAPVAYLVKPFALAELQHRIREAVALAEVTA